MFAKNFINVAILLELSFLNLWVLLYRLNNLTNELPIS